MQCARCGESFERAGALTCRTHPGKRLHREGKWECCGQLLHATGCVQMEHTTCKRVAAAHPAVASAHLLFRKQEQQQEVGKGREQQQAGKRCECTRCRGQDGATTTMRAKTRGGSTPVRHCVAGAQPLDREAVFHMFGIANQDQYLVVRDVSEEHVPYTWHVRAGQACRQITATVHELLGDRSWSVQQKRPVREDPLMPPASMLAGNCKRQKLSAPYLMICTCPVLKRVRVAHSVLRARTDNV